MMRPRQKIPLPEYPARRIALIKPSALGDIVHALPVLSALRRHYPEAHLTWVVNRSYEPLLRGHPDLDATLPFDRNLMHNSPWKAAHGGWTFFQHLRAGRFDLVLDLQGLFRSGLMCWASGAARRVGLSTAREGSRWFYTDLIHSPDWENLHTVERYWQAVRALGAGEQPLRFHVPIHDDALAWARQALADLPRPWLCFGVGARWPTKRWPPAHFAFLAEKAQQTFGGTIIFVGRGEETLLANTAAQNLAGSVCDLTGKTTLPQLAAVLSLADVMVANDTGPMHLAAALGRPVIAPYTCTKIEWHGPYGQSDRAAATSVWCRGSYLRRCARLECMSELTPDRLWPLVQESLKAWERHHECV